MHTHPAAGKRRRLSLVIMVAGYAAAWMTVVPVMANLAQTGLIARHHLDAHPDYPLRHPPAHETRRLASDGRVRLAEISSDCSGTDSDGRN